MRKPALYLLIALAVISLGLLARGAALFNLSPVVLLTWGGGYGPRVSSGGWWRLFTANFMCASIVSVGIWAAALWYASRLLEELSDRQFTFAVLVVGFLGTAISVHHRPLMVSVGPAAAVLGLYGLLLAFEGLDKKNKFIKSKQNKFLAGLSGALFLSLFLPAEITGPNNVLGAWVGLLAGAGLGVAFYFRKRFLFAFEATLGLYFILGILVAALTASEPDLISSLSHLNAQAKLIDNTMQTLSELPAVKSSKELRDRGHEFQEKVIAPILALQEATADIKKTHDPLIHAWVAKADDPLAMMLKKAHFIAFVMTQDAELLDLDESTRNHKTTFDQVMSRINTQILPVYRKAHANYIEDLRKVDGMSEARVLENDQPFIGREERLKDAVFSLDKALIDEDLRKLTGAYLQIMAQDKPLELRALESQVFMLQTFASHLSAIKSRHVTMLPFYSKTDSKVPTETISFEVTSLLLKATTTEALANARFAHLHDEVTGGQMNSVAAWKFIASSLAPVYIASLDSKTREPASNSTIETLDQQIRSYNDSRLSTLERMSKSLKKDDPHAWLMALADWNQLGDCELQRTLRSELNRIETLTVAQGFHK